jgi:hypothetical protein
MASSAKHKWTFPAITAKYRDRGRADILRDLIAATPRKEGKWFAAAKSEGLYGVAIELARRTPCDLRTLARAARDLVAGETLGKRFVTEILGRELGLS